MQVGGGMARGGPTGKGRGGEGRREEGDEVIMKMSNALGITASVHNQSVIITEKVGKRQIRTRRVHSAPVRARQDQSGHFRSFPVRFSRRSTSGSCSGMNVPWLDWEST